ITIDAIAGQAYPFPLVASRVQPQTDLSRAPLAQAMFLLHHAVRRDEIDLARFALGTSGDEVAFGDLTLQSIALERRFAQFDLALVMDETPHGLRGSLEYNADLFDAPTIASLAESLREIATAAAAHPDRRLADLPLLSTDRRDVIVQTWNATRTDYRRRD